MRFELRPERDVAWRDGRLVATSVEPWLAFDPPCPSDLAGRMVELTYRASLWDEPTRPIFRFWSADGRSVDRIAAGPIAGAGIWIGRVPRDTSRISVSPTNREGRFDFAVERVRVRSWLALLREGWRRHPRAARSALLTRLIGWSEESDVNLAWATAALPLTDHAAWLAPRVRGIDLAGLDRPRFDWTTGPPIHIVIGADDRSGLVRTLDSLRAQVFPRWTATILCETAALLESDPRWTVLPPGRAVSSLAVQAEGVFTTVLRAGDVLPPGALAIVAEQARRAPACRLLYGDALVRGEDGTAVPALQPGWSPRLFAAGLSLEAPLFVRDLKHIPAEARRVFLDTGLLPAAVLAAIEGSEAHPLRRIVIETSRRAGARMAPAAVTPSSTTARAAIIIPTRDHPALLRRAVASVRARTRPGSFRLAIVDNGSETAAAKALLADLATDPDIQCLNDPRPFNFSRICNAAAAAAAGDVLVFLNDDTEVISRDWLDRLVTRALDPGIGAVGAKLTYPDGRLQHVGVLAGMGESAGHFGALDRADAPGWAARNDRLHEVSAVTAACLAVSREKFEAVGGFDAEHLPVELSDVDLCLRLNARGWQSVVDPVVHLMHEESASRGGATFRRLDVHARERAVFRARWRHVLRDDPVFHPGLSLYSWRAALG